MKKLARREMWLAIVGGLGMAIFVTFWIVQDSLSDLKAASLAEKKVSDKLKATKKVLGKGPEVASQLEVLQRRLPRYGPDRDVTAEQMRTLDRIAQEQSFGLGQREPQAEGTNGVVREIVIHTAWNSNLDALTHFLYALQTQDVIFDVRRLTVIPIQGSADNLKGSLVINSAYAVSDEPTGTNTTVAVATNANVGAVTNTETGPGLAPGPTTNADLSSITNPPAPAAVITTNKPGTP
jgi:hypothetical protein